jgi:hypothetical protein
MSRRAGLLLRQQHPNQEAIMQIQAQELRQGDFVLGVGTVTRVRQFHSEVANRESKVTPIPDLKGAALHARAAQEAVEHAYKLEPSSLTVEFGARSVGYRPQQLVEVCRPRVPLAEAA